MLRCVGRHGTEGNAGGTVRVRGVQEGSAVGRVCGMEKSEECIAMRLVGVAPGDGDGDGDQLRIEERFADTTTATVLS